MKKIYILSPLIVFLEIIMFGIIAELLRQQSDVAVFIGVISACVFIGLNFLTINYIYKQFKNQKK